MTFAALVFLGSFVYLAKGILLAAVLRNKGILSAWDGPGLVTWTVVFWPLVLFNLVCNRSVDYLVTRLSSLLDKL